MRVATCVREDSPIFVAVHDTGREMMYIGARTNEEQYDEE